MEKYYWATAVVLVVGSLQACSDEGREEDVTGIRERVVNAWIGPVSEESGRNSAECQSYAPSAVGGAASVPPVGATNAFCGGAYCDDNWLFCGNLPSGLTAYAGGWSAYISEEAPNNQVICGTVGNVIGAIDAIRATGSYSDNISVRCLRIVKPPTGFLLGCSWTPYFSEEQAYANFPAGSFAAGVRCGGSYCDNLSYYVCRNVCIPCTTHADCGGGAACFSGCCGPS